MSASLHSVRSSAVIAGAALALGCSDALVPAISTPTAPLSPFVVSNARPAGSVGGTASRAGAAAATDANVVYVALLPGTIPNAQTVTIRVRPTGYTVAAPAVDGGLDPVAVPASPRDTLDLTVALSTGESPLHFISPVPSSKRPIVIRTTPPPKKRDVAINTNVIVVFSEPISIASLNGSVRLTSGTTTVSGQLGFEDAVHLTAIFSPDRPLAPATDYRLDVTQGIQDLDGQSLEAAVTVEFTTTVLPPASGQIAFVSRRDGASQIYIMNADGSGVTRLTSDAGEHGHPAWSPDGKKIAFTNDVGGVSDIYTMNADGSEVVRLTRDPLGSSDPAWSPDGTRIAFTRAIGGFGSRIAVMNADGSGVGLFPKSTASSFESIDRMPAWSPNGLTIAFNQQFFDDLNPSAIYLMQVDGSDVHILNRQTGGPGIGPIFFAEAAPVWSPDGTRLLFWSFWAAPATGNGSYPHSASPGFAMRRSDGSGDLMLVPISVPVSYFNTPGWSPDGNHIVFASGSAPDANLYVVNSDGSGLVRLTTGDQPAWRPRQ